MKIRILKKSAIAVGPLKPGQIPAQLEDYTIESDEDVDLLEQMFTQQQAFAPPPQILIPDLLRALREVVKPCASGQ